MVIWESQRAAATEQSGNLAGDRFEMIDRRDELIPVVLLGRHGARTFPPKKLASYHTQQKLLHEIIRALQELHSRELAKTDLTWLAEIERNR